MKDLLAESLKCQQEAAELGFDWPDVEPVFDKLLEEIQEVKQAVHTKESMERIEDELGDLIFQAINLCRHLQVNPSKALSRGKAKFETRFSRVKAKAKAHSLDLNTLNLKELEALWLEAKKYS